MWQPGGGDASFEFFVFAPIPIPLDDWEEGPVKLHDWCPYPQWHPGFGIDTLEREENPPFFDGMINVARAPESRATPGLVNDLVAARAAARITCAVEDPEDLGHLQFAWAVARWLIDEGASVVFDHEAKSWHAAADIVGWHSSGWPGGRKFSLAREVRMNLMPVPAEGRSGSLEIRHTYGMDKFGRPELLSFTRSEDRGWVEELFEQIATELAFGKLFDEGEALRAGGQNVSVIPYEPGVNAPDVGLSEGSVLLLPGSVRWSP